MATLHDKKNYRVHYTYLKRALFLGLKLKKIHAAIEFNQNAWLKSYIEENTRLRKLATDDFSIYFYKMMNLQVFGKTMENVTKWRNFVLSDDEAVIRKYVNRPEFKSRTIINEETDLTLMELRKTKIKFDRPLQDQNVL